MRAITTELSAVDISNALNPVSHLTWNVSVDKHDNVELVTDSGLRFWLSFGGYRNEGRIKISYSRPRDRKGSWVEVYENNYTLRDPSISVSQGRAPKAIASEILRRLLPDAEKVHALAVARIKAETSYEDKKQGTAKAVATICKTTARNVEDGKTPSVDIYAGLDERRGEFRLGYGDVTCSSDSIDIKLTSVPVAVGMEVVKAIRAVLESHKRS